MKLNTCIRAIEEYILKTFSLNLNLKPLSTILGTYLGPIDLLGTRKRRKISAIERTRRYREGAYIYYRKQEYFIKDYLKAPKNLTGNGAVLMEIEEKAEKE